VAPADSAHRAAVATAAVGAAATAVAGDEAKSAALGNLRF